METLIVVLFLSSFGCIINSMNRYRTFRLLNLDEREKYRMISKIPKTQRSEEEQHFYLQTQESFFCLMAAKYGFLLTLFLIIVNKLF